MQGHACAASALLRDGAKSTMTIVHGEQIIPADTACYLDPAMQTAAHMLVELSASLAATLC